MLGIRRLALIGLLCSAAASAQQQGELVIPGLPGEDCDPSGAIRVVHSGEPRIVSTWTFMPVQDDPNLINFAAGYQVNIQPYLDNINSNFANSAMWSNIAASGDCETRFESPSASYEKTATSLVIVISFRVKAVRCDSLYPGSRIDMGSSVYTAKVVLLPVLTYGSTSHTGGITRRTNPDIKFKALIASTNLSTSGFTGFIWDVVGPRIFGTPDFGEVNDMLDNELGTFIADADNLSMMNLTGMQFDLESAIDESIAQSGTGANIAKPLREAFVESMKPTRASWSLDFTKPDDLALNLQAEIKYPATTGNEFPKPVFPFQAKRSVMCELGGGVAMHFKSDMSKYRIVEIMLEDGTRITDPGVIYGNP